MIVVTATGRWATAQTSDILTTGSVGIPVTFNLSSEFDGLSPVAVFKGSGGTYDVAIVPGVVVPHETLTAPGAMLEIGVYARNASGTIVIPTVWATVGYIREGVAPSGVDPSEPTPDWTAQVQAIATEALEVATEARDDATTGAAAAKASADDAAESAGEAAGYASDASGYATAAETAQGKAEDAQGAAELAAGAAKDEADFLRNASATASTLSPGSSATVTLNDGVFTFGIPAGQQGEPGQDGVSPSVSVSPITGGHEVTITDADGAKSFDVLDGKDGNPGTAATVTVGTVTTLPAGSSATVTNVGTSSAAVFDFGIPKGPQGDAGVTSVNTQTGAVVLDAGDIGYDNSETYSSGSVGSEISGVKSAIQQKAAEPTGTKAAGKVYGLDSSLNPVWLTQSGGGGDDTAPVIVDSASGAIASFPDGTARPVVGLSVGIEPVQDLHGYANPWPGGGGKNLLNLETVTDGYRTTNVGGLTTANYAFVSEYIPVSANTDYYCNSVIPSSIGYAFCFYDSSKAFLRYVSASGGGAKVGNSGADAAFMRVTGLLSTKDSTIIAQSSSAVEFEPYSNICPITGWTGTDVWDEPTHDTSAQPTLSISWQTEAGTVYKGNASDNGDGTWTVKARPYYASYNGETLVGPWVSSMDAYAPGATPTIGAQVVDIGGTETSYTVPGATLSTLLGMNNVWATTGNVAVTYRADTKLFIDKMDGVSDVQVNGTSVVTDGVANITASMIDAPETVSGTTPTISAVAGTRYVCGEVATLTITVPASGIIDVVFESGSTPTVLTVTPPAGKTMAWANGFDPTALEANTTYEINIMDLMGVSASWT